MPKILRFMPGIFTLLSFYLKDQPLEPDISGINCRQPDQVVGPECQNVTTAYW